MVQSVAKGYEMIRLFISYLPIPLQALIYLVLGIIAVSCLASVVKFFLGGGN